MPRAAELKAEEGAVNSPLRRSSRIIAVASPAPVESGKVVKGRRLSTSSENNESDEKIESKAVRSKRATSITKESTELKAEPAKPRTRRSSASTEPAVPEGEKKQPITRRRSSATEETSQKGNELVKGRRTSITSKNAEVSEKPAGSSEEDGKSRPVTRRSSISKELSEETEGTKPLTRSRRRSFDIDVEVEVLEKKTTRQRRASTEKSEEPEQKVSKHTPVKNRRRPSITDNAAVLEPIEEKDGERKSLSPIPANEKTHHSLTPAKKKHEAIKTDLDLSIINECSFTEGNDSHTEEARSAEICVELPAEIDPSNVACEKENDEIENSTVAPVQSTMLPTESITISAESTTSTSEKITSSTESTMSVAESTTPPKDSKTVERKSTTPKKSPRFRSNIDSETVIDDSTKDRDVDSVLPDQKEGFANEQLTELNLSQSKIDVEIKSPKRSLVTPKKSSPEQASPRKSPRLQTKKNNEIKANDKTLDNDEIIGNMKKIESADDKIRSSLTNKESSRSLENMGVLKEKDSEGSLQEVSNFENDSVFSPRTTNSKEVSGKNSVTYISTGSEGSFQLHLSNSRLDSSLGETEDGDELNISKTSNSSDKENTAVNIVNDSSNSKNSLTSEKKILGVSTVLSEKQTVARVSNVFQPKNLDYSYMEPMDVDKTSVDLESTTFEKFDQSLGPKDLTDDSFNESSKLNTSLPFVESSKVIERVEITETVEAKVDVSDADLTTDKLTTEESNMDISKASCDLLPVESEEASSTSVPLTNLTANNENVLVMNNSIGNKPTMLEESISTPAEQGSSKVVEKESSDVVLSEKTLLSPDYEFQLPSDDEIENTQLPQNCSEVDNKSPRNSESEMEPSRTEVLQKETETEKFVEVIGDKALESSNEENISELSSSHNEQSSTTSDLHEPKGQSDEQKEQGTIEEMQSQVIGDKAVESSKEESISELSSSHMDQSSTTSELHESKGQSDKPKEQDTIEEMPNHVESTESEKTFGNASNQSDMKINKSKLVNEQIKEDETHQMNNVDETNIVLVDDNTKEDETYRSKVDQKTELDDEPNGGHDTIAKIADLTTTDAREMSENRILEGDIEVEGMVENEPEFIKSEPVMSDTKSPSKIKDSTTEKQSDKSREFECFNGSVEESEILNTDEEVAKHVLIRKNKESVITESLNEISFSTENKVTEIDLTNNEENVTEKDCTEEIRKESESVPSLSTSDKEKTEISVNTEVSEPDFKAALVEQPPVETETPTKLKKLKKNKKSRESKGNESDMEPEPNEVLVEQQSIITDTPKKRKGDKIDADVEDESEEIENGNGNLQTLNASINTLLEEAKKKIKIDTEAIAEIMASAVQIISKDNESSSKEELVAKSKLSETKKKDNEVDDTIETETAKCSIKKLSKKAKKKALAVDLADDLSDLKFNVDEHTHNSSENSIKSLRTTKKCKRSKQRKEHEAASDAKTKDLVETKKTPQSSLNEDDLEEIENKKLDSENSKTEKDILEGYSNPKLDEFLSKMSSNLKEENESEEDENEEDENEEEDESEENSFFLTMAEEGEEDTPSDDSNDIIDEGESINTTESERETDDDYDENDSFICDEDIIDLLSGDEYDLGNEKTKKKPKSRIINVEHCDSDVIKIQRKEKPEKPKRKSRIISVESSSEDDQEVIQSLDNKATREVKDEECVDKSINKRKSSITIIENINVNDIKDTVLSQRIHHLVDSFCTTIPNKADISMNLSLEYAGDEEKEISGKKQKEKLAEPSTEPKEEKSPQLSSEAKKVKSPQETTLKEKKNNKRSSNSKNECTVLTKKPRLSVSLTDTNDLDEDKVKKRKRFSKSLDDELNVNKSKKKSKTEKKEKASQVRDKRRSSLSGDDLKQSFNLLNQLITDVKNRPRRIVKPSTSKVDTDNDPWIVDIVNVKPSTSIVSETEIDNYKKKKVHPKDFRHQMLYDSSRVRRIETKKLLKKKGVYN